MRNWILMIILLVFAGLTFGAVSTDSIMNSLGNVADLAKGFGAGKVGHLVLLAGIVNLLVGLSKWHVINDKYGDMIKPYKPYLAMGLGVAGGIVDAMMGGAVGLDVMVNGIVVGIGSIGLHELSHAKGIEGVFAKMIEKVDFVEDKGERHL